MVVEEEELAMSQPAASPAHANRSSQLRPNTERRRVAAAATALASPPPSATKKTTTPNSASTVAKTRVGKSPAPLQKEADEEEWKERFERMEKIVELMREEKEKMKVEISDLRDKVEEEAWAKNQLEKKVDELSERLNEVEKHGAEGEGGGGREEPMANREDRLREERQKEIKDAENRLEARIKRMEEHDQTGGGEEGGGGGGGGGERRVKPKKRFIVLTDSNGRGATHETIMNHVPRGEREEMEVEVVVAYTLDEAYRRIDRGELRIQGAVVLVDNLTNDVRGMRSRPAVSPQQLLRLVDGVRRRVMAAGAVAVVVCQLKPMQTADVTPYNELLNDYLRREKNRGRDGFACRTQIRLDYLKADGYHIKPEYSSVLDRTYACAMLGMEVPSPTPWDEFVPTSVRQKWESDWPRLVGGGANMAHLRR